MTANRFWMGGKDIVVLDSSFEDGAGREDMERVGV
jgi:hypothetical protein